MQFRTLVALLTLAVVPSALAAPLDSATTELEARQYYDGPCAHEDCGVERINCRAPEIRMWCVRYPSVSQPEGCTCSRM
jgi:hypothetical protein